MIFRLSQKLFAKIKAGTLATLPLDENPFADRSAGVVPRRTFAVHPRDQYEVAVLYGAAGQRGFTDEKRDRPRVWVAGITDTEATSDGEKRLEIAIVGRT